MRRNIILSFLIIGSLTNTKPSISEDLKNINLISDNRKYELTKISDNSITNYQYLIGPGDILNMDLFDNDIYSGQYAVLNDGRASLPLIGNVSLEGKTLNEAREFLRERYSTQLLVPDLNLSLFQSRPLNITIIGEVQKPGFYKLDQTIKNPTTIIDAIQRAGGITIASNLEKINLIRSFKEQGEIIKKSTVLNLGNFSKSGDQSNNLVLMHGDIIKINKKENLSQSQYKLARETLSPSFIQITVVGEVKSPGTKKIYSGGSLIDAIMIAGGPKDWEANKQNIKLFRKNDSGEIIIESYKYKNNQKISMKDNPVLKDGDIINVDTTNYTKASRGMANIINPLKDIITAVTFYKLVN